MNSKELYQYALKSQFTKTYMKDKKTDARAGVPEPEKEKSYPNAAKRIDLIKPEAFSLKTVDVVKLIHQRRSHRAFLDQSLTLEELSFLLWSTQGVIAPAESTGDLRTTEYRAVPSGGGRHPFETYLIIDKVEGLAKGLYRYLPQEHQLLLIQEKEMMADLIPCVWNQAYIKQGAVFFLWAAIPYRTEWFFGMNSAKLIAQDSGHLCQNLYLAAEVIDSGICGIGAYDQELLDNYIDLDGEEEFVVYNAVVGKIEK